MISKYELNEKFNIINFKITGLTFHFSVTCNEKVDLCNVKSLVLVLKKSLKKKLETPKNNFITDLLSGRYQSNSTRKSLIYLVFSGHLHNNVTIGCLKNQNYNVNMSTFTLCFIIEHNEFIVCLFIPLYIPLEISIKPVEIKTTNNLSENINSQSSILIDRDEAIRKNSKVNAISSLQVLKPDEVITKLSDFSKLIIGIDNLEKRTNRFFKNIFSDFMKIGSSRFSSPKPIGFSNKKGYCYLNSVVQLLASCEDFSKYIESHNWKFNESTSNTKFVQGLFDLIRATRQNNKEKVSIFLNIVQNYCTESSYGDDVYKCFMNTLSRINTVFQEYKIETENCISPPKENFKKNQIPIFLHDNFYGQIRFQTICKECRSLCNESFQCFKSLPLSIPKSKSAITLENCVNLFFKPEEVKLNEPMECECRNGSMKIESVTKLISGPKYLFIYLNRGSFINQEKNNTFVKCDKLTVDLETVENGVINYKLISVLDHESSFNFGHYYCKCNYERDKWWLLNDAKVSQRKCTDIVTRNTIAFMFKKRSEI